MIQAEKDCDTAGHNMKKDPKWNAMFQVLSKFGLQSLVEGVASTWIIQFIFLVLVFIIIGKKGFFFFGV